MTISGFPCFQSQNYFYQICDASNTSCHSYSANISKMHETHIKSWSVQVSKCFQSQNYQVCDASKTSCHSHSSAKFIKHKSNYGQFRSPIAFNHRIIRSVMHQKHPATVTHQQNESSTNQIMVSSGLQMLSITELSGL